MDTITGMRTFCAVAKEGSFVKAARQLGFSPALTSKYVGQLEERLGVRLLNRTTRSLALTENGRAYLAQASHMIADFDALEASMQASQNAPSGKIVMTAPRILGRGMLGEGLAQFLKRYGDISLELRLSERLVDVVEEGFDLAIRAGALKDSSLIARKLAPMKVILSASPQYLKENGIPQNPSALESHSCIVDSNFEGGRAWSFLVDGERMTVMVPSRLQANSAQTCRLMALNHLGIIMSPDRVVNEDIAAGRLVRLLEDYNAFDLGIYVLYPHNRHLPVKVRVLIDFLKDWFAKDSRTDQVS